VEPPAPGEKVDLQPARQVLIAYEHRKIMQFPKHLDCVCLSMHTASMAISSQMWIPCVILLRSTEPKSEKYWTTLHMDSLKRISTRRSLLQMVLAELLISCQRSGHCETLSSTSKKCIAGRSASNVCTCSIELKEIF